MMFLEYVTLFLPDYFIYFVSYDQFTIWTLRASLPRKMTSKLRNAFLHASRAESICFKLFKHWSELIAKIEAYHPYRQSVVIILSILMMMRLLWIPFNDTYRKIMCVMG